MKTTFSFARILLSSILFVLVLSTVAHAQDSSSTVPVVTTPDPTAPVSPLPIPALDGKNYVAAGLSYSINAKPAVAGTALYSRDINTTGLSTFTVFDVLPNSLKPFTVTSNVGAGLAQKVTISGKDIYFPTAAGISWNGPNVGWQWNTGVLIPIAKIKSYDIDFAARALKSSVSNGTSYQPMFTILIGKRI
jgi:hypothetical protein